MRYIVLWTAALLFLLLMHWWGLAWVPGLHYDEAWAANYSWRIAFEPGFWPWRGMSPYTSPWAHYWAALAFKLFGTSVFVYRASQSILAIAGLWLIARTLAMRVGEKAGLTFLLLAASSMALVMNHRFAIELTGLHVFCLGLVFWSFRRAEIVAVGPLVIAILIGVTSHLLFYVIAIALLFFWLASPLTLPGNLRRGGYVVWIVLLPFFCQIAWNIPEKKKAIALLLLHIFLGIFLALQHRIRWGWVLEQWRHSWVRALVFLAASLPLANAVLFAEGTWQARIQSGLVISPWWIGLGLWLLGIFWGAKREPRFFFLAALVAAGIMAITPKPTPRYSEMIFLLLVLVITLGIRNMTSWPRRIFISLWLLLGFAQAAWLYFPPLEKGMQQDRQFSWLFFRDSSADFLSEQDLLVALGREGCGTNDLTTGDGRLLESLRFLEKTSLGKIREPGGCRRLEAKNNLLRVEREGLLPTTAPKVAWMVQGYWLWSEKNER